MILAATFEFGMALSWFQPAPPPQPTPPNGRFVKVTISPEAMASSEDTYGPLRMGLWTVYIQAGYAGQIDAADIYLAAAQQNVGLIGRDRAIASLEKIRRDRPRSRIVKGMAILTGACAGVLALRARATDSERLMKIVGPCGVASGMFAYLGPKLEATIPQLDTSTILGGKLSFSAGETVTRIVFARKRPNPQTVTFQIPQ